MPLTSRYQAVWPRRAQASSELQATINAFRLAGHDVTGGPENHGTRCPNHEDVAASLSISDGNTGVLFRCHAGCEQDEVFESVVAFLGMARSDFFYDHRASAPAGPVVTVAELAAAKNLPINLFASAGVVDGPQGILFPYWNGAASHRTRIRRTLTGPSRFLWQRGEGQITAYGAWRLPQYRAGGVLFLVEGETDTLTGIHHGRPVLGIPGKNMARSVLSKNPSLTTGIDTIFIVEEPDDLEQRAFLTGVRRGLADITWRGDIFPMRLPVKDLSDLHLTFGPEGFMAAFKAADFEAVDAPTWPDPAPIPLAAAEVFTTIRPGDFPATFRVQDVRNRRREMTSESIRSALTQLERASIVRRIAPARRRGRPAEVFKTNPKVRM